jgi:TfoX/Sxy family transcriptional regulator of competence genes
MSFDPGLAERVREVLAHRQDITERRMFGGLGVVVRRACGGAAPKEKVVVRNVHAL